MNNLEDYLENYVKQTLDMVLNLAYSGDIGELQSQMIISSLLDTSDEFDDESNITINKLVEEFI